MSKINVLPNLYPLRFFLAAFVILFHLPLISQTLGIPSFNAWPIFQKGIQAVYYFFTLSGFLIIRIVYKEIRDTDDFGFKRFYKRRIQRLYPVYYLVFAIGVLLYHLVLPFIGISFEINYTLPKLIVSYVFFAPNIFLYYYPDVGGILLILWSIGIEEQFYLFMPMFLYLTKDRMKTSMAVLLVLLIGILFFLKSFYIYRNFYFYFVAGGLASVLSLEKNYDILHAKILHILVYISFLMAFFTNWFVFSGSVVQQVENIPYHLVNLVISTLLILLISDYPMFEIKNKTLTYFGKISYGIYMYHFIILTGILFVVQKVPIYEHMNTYLFIGLLNIVVIAGAVFISHLSYKYFERRFYQSRT